MPRVEYDKLTDDRLGEPSAAVRARIEKARAVQRARFGVDGLADPSRITRHASFTPASLKNEISVQ